MDVCWGSAARYALLIYSAGHGYSLLQVTGHLSKPAHCLSAPEQPASRILTFLTAGALAAGVQYAALLRQRLGEAVPAIVLPPPMPPAQPALGLDAAAPHTPAQLVQALGGLTSPPKPTPQPEREPFAFDGDAASYTSDAASDADNEDLPEWAHEFALAPHADVIAVIEEAAPAVAADPVLEGPPAQELAPPAQYKDHLGAACARFITAPAIFLVSSVEACVPGAAPVRGSLSTPACLLCRPCPSKSISHYSCSGPLLTFISTMHVVCMRR